MGDANLSAAANKLIELCGHDGKVEEALKSNPELVSGLDEYLRWRDLENKRIEEKQQIPAVSHSLKKIAESLPTTGKK
jgi:hypothetical protein